MKLIAFLFRFGPLLFGLGFLAPVIAATLDAFRLTDVFGFAPLTFGLIIGGVLGAIATVRKSWL